MLHLSFKSIANRETFGKGFLFWDIARMSISNWEYWSLCFREMNTGAKKGNFSRPLLLGGGGRQGLGIKCLLKGLFLHPSLKLCTHLLFAKAIFVPR